MEQNEETRIQKNEERLRKLQDNFKCYNIRIIGVPEGEEEEQEIENLFENIMKENFPKLAKEIEGSPGSSDWASRKPNSDCFFCQIGKVLLHYVFK